MNVKPIKITGKGYFLSATLVLPDINDYKLPAVIFYHGMISQSKPRYLNRAKKLAEKGIIGLVFDFRGCGESDGKIGELRLLDWLDDALLAFAFLSEQKEVDKNRIGISGKSFGGYMAALVSEKRKIKSMVLQAPAVYPDEWLNKPFELSNWHNNKFTKERSLYRKSKSRFDNRAIYAIKKFRNPLLVVGSELDDTCPKNIVEGYYKLCPSPKKKIYWIKDADHPLTKPVWDNEYTEEMNNWFSETL